MLLFTKKINLKCCAGGRTGNATLGNVVILRMESMNSGRGRNFLALKRAMESMETNRLQGTVDSKSVPGFHRGAQSVDQRAGHNTLVMMERNIITMHVLG